VEVKPWTPAQATEKIQRNAREDGFDIYYTAHARSQMLDRGLLVGDVLHVLRRGCIYENGLPATSAGLYKFCMESRTPNSGNRTVRVVFIPSTSASSVKIVTVMWADSSGQGS
jgi:hypothetical protein